MIQYSLVSSPPPPPPAIPSPHPLAVLADKLFLFKERFLLGEPPSRRIFLTEGENFMSAKFFSAKNSKYKTSPRTDSFSGFCLSLGSRLPCGLFTSWSFYPVGVCKFPSFKGFSQMAGFSFFADFSSIVNI
jgi:hypothetical protein